MAQKQKQSVFLGSSERFAKLVMFAAAGAMIVSPLPLLASEYDSQIKSTESVIGSYAQEQVRLGALAGELETEIANLDAQLAVINEQIGRNKAEYEMLSDRLEKVKKDVAKESDNVETVLRQSYLDDQVSLIEMIASRSSLSRYMDYYEARDRIQSRVLASLGKLKVARDKVKKQRAEIAAVLKEGKAMQESLAFKRNEQEKLLTDTRNQQQLYAKLITQRNERIAELRAEQLGANQTFFVSGQVVAGDPNRGGYPDNLNSAPLDALVDPWGMYNRECVSYTAWKVHQTFGRMPFWGGRGNANQWPSSARADGIDVGNQPKQYAVAIAFIGPYGHSMFVEEILTGGKIRISEYNYYVNGTYTERIIPSSGLTYIYFN